MTTPLFDKADKWLSRTLVAWFFAFLLLILFFYFLTIGYEYEGRTLWEIVIR